MILLSVLMECHHPEFLGAGDQKTMVEIGHLRPMMKRVEKWEAWAW